MKTNTTVGRVFLGILLSGVSVLSPSRGAAATYTWDGETDGNWGTAANWDAPPVFAAGNEFVFYTGVGELNTFLGAARTIGGLTFTDNADSDIIIRTYSNNSGIGGANSILTFDNGASDAFINVASGAAANISLAIGGARFYLDSNLVITHNGSGNLRIGQWMDDRSTGSHSITKNGTGTLTLGTTSLYPYDGGLFISAGKVRIEDKGTLGTGLLTMTGGALSSTGTMAIVITNNAMLSGGVTLGDATDAGTLSFAAANTVTLAGNLALDVASDVTFSGIVGESGGNYSLTKTGAGTLTLGNNANTFSGGLNINGGVVSSGNADGRLGAPGSAVSFDNGATLLFTGGLTPVTFSRETTLNSGGGVIDVQSAPVTITWSQSISGPGALTKAGAGTLALSAAANGFGGGLYINGGVVTVANADNRFGASGGAVSFDGGSLNFIGTVADFTTSDRATTLNAGGGAIDVLSVERTITWAGTIGGTGDFAKTGAGTLVLTRDNTYDGTTTVTEGTLRINGTHSGGGLITVQNGATLGGDGTAGDALVQSGGTLAPGNSVGILTLADLTLDGGSTLAWEFDGVGGVDQVEVNRLLKGTGSGWTFDFLGTGSAGTFTLARFSDSTDFATGDFTVTGLASGYTAPAGVVVDGTNQELTLTVIPEPASLGVIGMLTLAWILRRRTAR
jgi:autotransporter-associated beta strand protein